MPQQRLNDLRQNFIYFKKLLKVFTLKRYRSIEILVFWSKHHLTRFQFLVLSGILVGFTGGVAGILLKTAVHYIHLLVSQDKPISQQVGILFFFPILGIILTIFVGRKLYKHKEDIKLEQIQIDIAQNGSNIDKKEMSSQMVQSAITVGFGGSAGLESPMAITGAAIGSNFAQRYRLGYKEKTLLLAGAASAGIASAFNAPIAGIMFSFELLLTGIVFSDFIPLVIASMCGSLLTRVVLSDEILFNLNDRDLFDYKNIFYYILLGICAGFYARYYILASGKVKRILDKLPTGSFAKAIFGGLILALLCVVFPPLFGEGYVNIKFLHEGNLHLLIHPNIINYFDAPKLTLLGMIGLSTLFKPIATSVTLNSGGVGGNFAPSLIAGGLLGFTLGYSLTLIGLDNVPITNMMLVGMAGALSGILYAPLTGIFLIAEASSAYDLLIPLMLVSVTSFLINKYYSPINPTLTKLAAEGKVFTTRHDQNILSQIDPQECLDDNDITIRHDKTLWEASEYFKTSDKLIIAVIDSENTFWGLVNKEQMISLYKSNVPWQNKRVEEIALQPSNLIYMEDTMPVIMAKFEEADSWHLPLVDKNHRYMGFVSRFKILKCYRDLLKDLS
jgi:CIC family chloride channel protein